FFHNAVVRNCFPDHAFWRKMWPGLLVGQCLCRHFQRGRFHEFFGGVLIGEKRFDLVTQVVVPRAGFLDKCSPLACLTLQGRPKQLLNLLPTFGLHNVSPLRSSCKSHILASFQSRITVSAETLSTSAVSSTLSPPKKRSSTTWPFLGSTVVRAFSASSSAIRSARGCCETTGASSSDTGPVPASRLSVWRERAKSI